MATLQSLLAGPTFWGVLLGVAVLIFWLLGAYNRLTRLRAAVIATFPALEIQLRKRHSLAKHLSEMLLKPSPAVTTTFPASVINAAVDALKAVQTASDAIDRLPKRSAAPAPMLDVQTAETALETAEDQLDEALKNAALEAPLPTPVAELLDRLHRLGNPIAYSVSVYNQAAAGYNEALTVIPTTVVVRLFVFKPAVALVLRRLTVRRVSSTASSAEGTSASNAPVDGPDFSTTTTADLEPS